MRFLYGASVIAGVIAVSIAAQMMGLNLASASLVQLLVVVIVARKLGLWTATVVSVVAVVCLNYLFIPPVFTFRIADPENLVSLVAFEAIALIVSQLSATARRQRLLAELERNDSRRLYEASRQMLILDRRRAPGPQMMRLIETVFHPEAAVLFDADLIRTDSSDSAPEEMGRATRNAHLTDRDSYDQVHRTWYRVLRLGSRPTGALALRGERITAYMADGLASLAALGFERARSFEAESRAVAEHHTEQLRTAVLDALAHEIKTPLTAIRAATAGLLELTDLSTDQKELAVLVDEESARLNDLASRLLGTARLEAEDVVPRRTATALQLLIDDLVLEGASRLNGRETKVNVINGDAHALADRHLLTVAAIQVLDNAAKYSTPSTPITLQGWATESEVCLSISNVGSKIPAAERNHIFDRFYRLPSSAHRVSGTGLGLYITRKIVEAHRGRVWTESTSHETVFTIALPRHFGSSS